MAKGKPKKATPWYRQRCMIADVVERHADDRGALTVIANARSFGHPIGAVAVLVSKAGTVRGEHRHRREGHIVHVVSGRMVYRVRSAAGLVNRTVGPGEAVFTPPNVDHAFLFTADSVCVVIANISRTQEAYEADLTRLEDAAKLFLEAEVLAAAGIPHGLPPSGKPKGE